MLGRVLSDVWRSLFLTRKEPANPLEAYFLSNPGRLIQKWHHYFEIYHHHLARYRGTPCTIVEFGVFHGGSLQMWKHYLASDRADILRRSRLASGLVQLHTRLVHNFAPARDFR